MRGLCDDIGDVFGQFAKKWGSFKLMQEKNRKEVALNKKARKASKTIKKPSKSSPSPARVTEIAIVNVQIQALNKAINRPSTDEIVNEQIDADAGKDAPEPPQAPPVAVDFTRRGFRRKG